jgi:hypothetical protein
MAPETQVVDPDQEVLEVQLPADLLQDVPVEVPADAETPTPGAEGSEPAATTAEGAPPATETRPPDGEKRAPMVPKAALDAERSRRKEYQRKFEESERLREEYHQEAARARREAEARRQPERPNYEDTNRFKSLNDIAADLEQRIEQRVRGELAARDAALVAEKVARTQTAFERDHKDYRDVLRRSGVLADIRPDAQSGRPRDPWLYQHIYQSEDPARTAYEYAQGRLAKEREADAEIRGEARGRRETVQQVVAAADRPRGIGALPGSTSARTGLTRPQIHAMTDDQKARLKKDRPDVWQWYLGGA